MSQERDIFRHSRYARNEARELLQSIFVGEFLRPSAELWIVSPWLSDIEVIAETTGAFAFLMGGESHTSLTLSTAVARLAKAGARVYIVTRPGVSIGFHNALNRHIESLELDGRVTWKEVSTLHTKGLVGDDYRIMGSMNFTFSGIEINEEAIHFGRNPDAVARARLQFEREYGGEDG